MFAYCNNNPIAVYDPCGTGLLSAIICGVVGFVSTLVTGGSFEEACVNAIADAIAGGIGGTIGRILLSCYSTINTLVSGGSLVEGLESGAISFCTSFVSGGDILGEAAKNGEKAIIDLTFGFAAEMIGTVIDKKLVQHKKSTSKDVTTSSSASSTNTTTSPSGSIANATTFPRNSHPNTNVVRSNWTAPARRTHFGGGGRAALYATLR